MAVPQGVPDAGANDCRDLWYCIRSTPSSARWAARSASAARWSASCIMPKMSTMSSAGPWSTSSMPRRPSCSTHDPPWGLGYSSTRVPCRMNRRPRRRRRQPRPEHERRGLDPRGSSGVVGSSSICTSPLAVLMTIRKGYSGSGSGSPGAGKRSDGGWEPRSRTTNPPGSPVQRSRQLSMGCGRSTAAVIWSVMVMPFGTTGQETVAGSAKRSVARSRRPSPASCWIFFRRTNRGPSKSSAVSALPVRPSRSPGCRPGSSRRDRTRAAPHGSW